MSTNYASRFNNRVELLLPESWASFVYYGVTDGYESDELRLMQDTLQQYEVSPIECVSVEPHGFTWHNDSPVGGMCSLYVFVPLETLLAEVQS